MSIKLSLLSMQTPKLMCSPRATTPRTTTPRSTNSPRDNSFNNEIPRRGPLCYVDQILRDVDINTANTFSNLIRTSAPNVTNKTLVELSIVIGCYDIVPKCKQASLQIPKLISLIKNKYNEVDTVLKIVCTKEDIFNYSATPDRSKSTYTIEHAIEEIAELWCGGGPLHNKTVSLQNPDELMCHLVNKYAHHVLDAVILVRTMCMCNMIDKIRYVVAKLQLEGSFIRELQPSTRLLVARRRIMLGQRVAVIDSFHLKIKEIRGNGLSSLLPVRWCIEPKYVLELVTGMHNTVQMPMIAVIRSDVTAFEVMSKLDTLLYVRDCIFCNFVTFESIEIASTVLIELENYLMTHRLKEETQEIEL